MDAAVAAGTQHGQAGAVRIVRASAPPRAPSRARARIRAARVTRAVRAIRATHATRATCGANCRAIDPEARRAPSRRSSGRTSRRTSRPAPRGALPYASADSAGVGAMPADCCSSARARGREDAKGSRSSVRRVACSTHSWSTRSRRARAYIVNIVKCGRPEPHARAAEVAACLPTSTARSSFCARVSSSRWGSARPRPARRRRDHREPAWKSPPLSGRAARGEYHPAYLLRSLTDKPKHGKICWWRDVPWRSSGKRQVPIRVALATRAHAPIFEPQVMRPARCQRRRNHGANLPACSPSSPRFCSGAAATTICSARTKASRVLVQV